MGKRRPVAIVSSSEDEPGELRGGPSGGSHGRSRCRSRPGSVPPRSAASKKGRFSGDASLDADWVKLEKLSEDFCDHLHDFRITPGITCIYGNELWIEKHKPCSLVELAVHKKKLKKKLEKVNVESEVQGIIEYSDIQKKKMSLTSEVQSQGRAFGFKFLRMVERMVKDEQGIIEYSDIQKKKMSLTSEVDEIKRWLEERMTVSRDQIHKNVLLVTGKAGVGKSTALHVISSQLGAELCEWTTPTPTLWKEHIHTSTSGLSYISKLEEFENFVEKTHKYSLLHPISTGKSRKPTILLIDDLPVVNGRGAFSKLVKCLTTLCQLARIPTIIMLTEYRQTEYASNITPYLEDLMSSIERAGAYKVSFNPITVNSIKKTLTKLCQVEKYDVPAQLIEQIAKESEGDIKSSIMSLQYLCLRMDKSLASEKWGPDATQQERNNAKPSLQLSSSMGELITDSLMSRPCGRDETLSLFHALGKFLHNKRHSQTETSFDLIALKESLQRYPLRMDTPENVLSQAYAQSRPVTDFLHENVLDFIADDAIESAWVVSSYLSDADYLLGSSLNSRFSRTRDEIYEVNSLSQSIAASVAARGVLFGNSQPSPSRWHTIRTPLLWKFEQSLRSNKIQILLERFEARKCSTISAATYLATEYKPAIKWIHSPYNVHGNENVSTNFSMEKFDIDPTDEEDAMENLADESEEDEIEAC